MFSCDIAYSDSPAASRASARLHVAPRVDDLAVAHVCRPTAVFVSRAARCAYCERLRAEARPPAPRRRYCSISIELLPGVEAPPQTPEPAPRTMRHLRLANLRTCRPIRSSGSADGSAWPSWRLGLAVLKGYKPLDHLAHDLHVLLRHRLLRQPGGFEGFGLGREELDPHDLAVAEGEEQK